MAKHFNIDWEPKTKIQGKCNYRACPLKETCLRFTANEMDMDYGWHHPPTNKDGVLPAKMFCWVSNAPFKPAQRPFDVQD